MRWGDPWTNNYVVYNTPTTITSTSSAISVASWEASWLDVTGANDSCTTYTYCGGEVLPPSPEAKARVELINQRAAELLYAHLSNEQRASWKEKRQFIVRGASGRRYLLTAKRTHNVFLLDAAGKPVLEYCAYAKDDGWLPLEDNLFAQMITLQFDELTFLKSANVWRLPQRLFIGQGGDTMIALPAAA